MHNTSLIIAKQLIEKYLDDDPLEVLDIGSAICGDQAKLGTYRQFMKPQWNYTGCDLVKAPNVDVVLASFYNWQFDNDYFDVIISGQVLEHVEFPWIWIKEVTRILKPNGMCILIAPTVSKEHKCPIDTFRYYPDGMIALAKWASLTVLEAQMWPTKRDCYMVTTKLKEGQLHAA